MSQKFEVSENLWKC